MKRKRLKLVRRKRSNHGRPPSIKPGDKLGSLTAVRHVGLLGPYSAWLFRCKCGNECVKYAAQVKYQATHGDKKNYCHCGCKRHKHVHGGLSYGTKNRQAYQLWRLHKAELCPRWAKSFVLFLDECYAYKPKRVRRNLYPPNPALPLSPRNFRWDRNTRKGAATIEKAVAALVAMGETKKRARERAESVSRQRLHQIVAKARKILGFSA